MRRRGLITGSLSPARPHVQPDRIGAPLGEAVVPYDSAPWAHDDDDDHRRSAILSYEDRRAATRPLAAQSHVAQLHTEPDTYPTDLTAAFDKAFKTNGWYDVVSPLSWTKSIPADELNYRIQVLSDFMRVVTKTEKGVFEDTQRRRMNYFTENGLNVDAIFKRATMSHASDTTSVTRASVTSVDEFGLRFKDEFLKAMAFDQGAMDLVTELANPTTRAFLYDIKDADETLTDGQTDLRVQARAALIAALATANTEPLPQGSEKVTEYLVKEMETLYTMQSIQLPSGRVGDMVKARFRDEAEKAIKAYHRTTATTLYRASRIAYPVAFVGFAQILPQIARMATFWGTGSFTMTSIAASSITNPYAPIIIGCLALLSSSAVRASHKAMPHVTRVATLGAIAELGGMRSMMGLAQAGVGAFFGFVPVAASGAATAAPTTDTLGVILATAGEAVSNFARGSAAAVLDVSYRFSLGLALGDGASYFQNAGLYNDATREDMRRDEAYTAAQDLLDEEGAQFNSQMRALFATTHLVAAPVLLMMVHERAKGGRGYDKLSACLLAASLRTATTGFWDSTDGIPTDLLSSVAYYAGAYIVPGVVLGMAVSKSRRSQIFTRCASNTALLAQLVTLITNSGPLLFEALRYDNSDVSLDSSLLGPSAWLITTGMLFVSWERLRGTTALIWLARRSGSAGRYTARRVGWSALTLVRYTIAKTQGALSDLVSSARSSRDAVLLGTNTTHLAEAARHISQPHEIMALANEALSNRVADYDMGVRDRFHHAYSHSGSWSANACHVVILTTTLLLLTMAVSFLEAHLEDVVSEIYARLGDGDQTILDAVLGGLKQKFSGVENADAKMARLQDVIDAAERRRKRS